MGADFQEERPQEKNVENKPKDQGTGMCISNTYTGNNVENEQNGQGPQTPAGGTLPAPSSFVSSEHYKKVESIKDEVREAYRKKGGYSDEQIEEIIAEYEIDLLDHNYVELEREKLFQKYFNEKEISEDVFYEENDKVSRDSNYVSSIEGFYDLKREIDALEKRIENANSFLSKACYSGTITLSTNIEESVERLCGALKEGLSEDDYKELTDFVKDYFDNHRNYSIDRDLERILYDLEKSTAQCFPLEGIDKVNYFAGRIYATLARVTGSGYREAISFLTNCSPEVFGINKYSRFKHVNVISFEKLTNLMWGASGGAMPRWFGLDFLPIKDPVLRRLVSATKEFNWEHYEKALSIYKELYNNAQERGDKVVENFVAIMCANCASRLSGGPDRFYFCLRKNDDVLKWLERASVKYASSLHEGLKNQ